MLLLNQPPFSSKAKVEGKKTGFSKY